MSDPLTKKIDLCGSDMSRSDRDDISETIYEVLMEKGIFTDGFSWVVSVEYFPQKDDDV